MKYQTIVYQGINRDIIESIGVVQDGGLLVKVLLVRHGEKNSLDQELAMNIKNGYLDNANII